MPDPGPIHIHAEIIDIRRHPGNTVEALVEFVGRSARPPRTILFRTRRWIEVGKIPRSWNQ